MCISVADTLSCCPVDKLELIYTCEQCVRKHKHDADTTQTILSGWPKQQGPVPIVSYYDIVIS